MYYYGRLAMKLSHFVFVLFFSAYFFFVALCKAQLAAANYERETRTPSKLDMGCMLSNLFYCIIHPLHFELVLSNTTSSKMLLFFRFHLYFFSFPLTVLLFCFCIFVVVLRFVSRCVMGTKNHHPQPKVSQKSFVF